MDFLTNPQSGVRPHTATVGPFKVVLLGNAGVGKTSILEQYVNRSFTVDYKSSLGVDYFSASQRVGGAVSAHIDRHRHPPQPQPQNGPSETIVDLQLWDTAGQERYRALSRSFYQGAQAAVFVFDATDVERSLTAALKWFDDMVELTDGAAGVKAVVFAANKIDLLKADVAMPAANDQDDATTPRSRHAVSVSPSEQVRPSSAPVPSESESHHDASTRMSVVQQQQRPTAQLQLVVMRARAILDSRPDTSQLPVLACSAKFGTGIGDVFEHVARQVSFQEEESAPASATVSLSKSDSEMSASRGRCSRC